MDHNLTSFLKEAARKKRIAEGEVLPDLEHKPHHNHMLMMRILGPLITFVNRPWKSLSYEVTYLSQMYPVGVLFGFGFDTASSIALLAISAIAKRGSDGRLLFTAGMTLVDSADSILMLYSYIGFPRRGWVLLEKKSTMPEVTPPEPQEKAADEKALEVPPTSSINAEETKAPVNMTSVVPVSPHVDAEAAFSVGNRDKKISRDTEAKMNVMSGLSIILTIMSILVAFRTELRDELALSAYH
ncbi:hypothetical protein C0995_006580 [Termitomyces sp. Mi166|nr:hypothetical protein C0995_006580 [Termitomyces sp. Mi166\